MPTPIVHSTIAFVVFQLEKRPWAFKRWRYCLTALTVSNLADLDLIPGISAGTPTVFHHYYSHSLLVAAVIALFGFALARARLAGLIAIALSHPLLDIFTVDRQGLYQDHHGIPLFWPLSSHLFDPIAPIFSAPFLGTGPASLVSWHNAQVILFDTAVSLLVILATLLLQRTIFTIGPIRSMKD